MLSLPSSVPLTVPSSLPTISSAWLHSSACDQCLSWLALRASFGAASPFRCAQSSFMAAAIRFRSDALKKDLCDRSTTNWRPKLPLFLRLPSQPEAKMRQS